MFVRLDMRDMNMFGRGIAVFLCVVTLGLVVTEMQVNALTHWRDSVGVCRIERDVAGKYVAWLLGNQYDIHASFQMAKLTRREPHLIVEAGGYQVAIPTKVTVDTSDWLLSLENAMHWCEKKLSAGTEYLRKWAYSLKPVAEQIISTLVFWLKSIWDFIVHFLDTMLADLVQQMV